MQKKGDIALGWIQWFIHQMRTGPFLQSNIVMWGMAAKDEEELEFPYKNLMEGLPEQYLVQIRDLRRYIYHSLWRMGAGVHTVGIGIAFKNVAVAPAELFGPEYAASNGKGITVYFERFLQDNRPLVYWLPNIDRSEQKVVFGNIGWGRFVDYVMAKHPGSSLSDMLHDLGIASSDKPETWNGFDSYDDFLNYAKGKRDE